MLRELHIRDFAIVRELELALADGFTVLTGETGAGKSILIDALALALGQRADSGVIRHGCKRAEISARFELSPDHTALAWLRERELSDDEETVCLLRRVIEAERPSKGFINGRPVPIQFLREIGELLVDVHGQHEHQSLLRRDVQREILDAYAGAADEAAQLAARHRELASLHARLEALTRDGRDRAARLEFVRYQVEELETLALSEDEVPQLEDEHRRLANAAELLDGAQAAIYGLVDDDENSVTTALARVLARLEALGEFDARLQTISALVNEAVIQIDEAAAQLRQYQDGLELDPQRLQAVEQRLGTAHDLARKHHVTPDQLPAMLEQLRAELGEIEHADENTHMLREQIDRARSECLTLARALSRKRKTGARRLNDAVTAQMQILGMPGGRFEIALTALPEEQLGASGLEQVEFQVSANAGQPLKPLVKVASGGELSRISLALQVAAAGAARIPTLIFDEVDVGIGGKVAQIVGGQLRRLGQDRQVLCVTHLAQVAAQADHHLQVSKSQRAGATFTNIQPLTPADRVHEIARMIGGIEISEQTLAHAREMLDVTA